MLKDATKLISTTVTTYAIKASTFVYVDPLKIISYIFLINNSSFVKRQNDFKPNKPDEQVCSSKRVKKSLQASSRDSSLDPC